MSKSAQVAELAAQVQEATHEAVEVVFVDQADTGEQPAVDADAQGMRLQAVKLPTAKRGFVLFELIVKRVLSHC